MRKIGWMPVAVVAALAPFALTALAHRWLANRMAEDMAASIDRLASALPDESDDELAEDLEGATLTKDRPAPKVAANKEPKQKPRGIGVLVSKKKLRALIAAGARPGGQPVAATSYRPAGLSLVGVSGLGVGMRDGDVLTSVGGAPATSYGSVVAAVASALRAGAPGISGEAWRGEQRIFITVELPGVAPDKPPDKPPAKKPPAKKLEDKERAAEQHHRAARPQVANKPKG